MTAIENPRQTGDYLHDAVDDELIDLRNISDPKERAEASLRALDAANDASKRFGQLRRQAIVDLLEIHPPPKVAEMLNLTVARVYAIRAEEGLGSRNRNKAQAS